MTSTVQESLENLAHAFIAFGNSLLSSINSDGIVARAQPSASPEKKKRIKKEKVEKKPRPQSAYNLFVKENMDKIKGSGDFENQKDVMTAIGSAWRSLDVDDKQVYQRKAEIQKSGAGAPDPEQVPKAPKTPESAQGSGAASSQKKKKHEETSVIDSGKGGEIGESAKKKKKKEKAREEYEVQEAQEVPAVYEIPQDGEKKKKKKKKKSPLDDTELE